MALALVGGSGTSCFSDSVPTEGRIHLHPGMVIDAVGDSLTMGNVNAPWLTQYKAWSDAWFIARGLTPPTWINSGVGGTGSQYFSDNIPTLINQHNPDLVIIAYGINDIGAMTLQQHLDRMTTGLGLITGAPRLAFCSPFARNTVTDAEIRAMRTAQADTLARPRGATFIDWRAYADSLAPAALAALLFDGIHPTHPAGNAFLSFTAIHQTVLHTEALP